MVLFGGFRKWPAREGNPQDPRTDMRFHLPKPAPSSNSEEALMAKWNFGLKGPPAALKQRSLSRMWLPSIDSKLSWRRGRWLWRLGRPYQEIISFSAYPDNVV